MALSPTALERPRLVIVQVVAIGALILIVVLVLVASEEHEPHVDLAPPAQSLSAPPMPVASGGVAPGHVPSWRLT